MISENDFLDPVERAQENVMKQIHPQTPVGQTTLPYTSLSLPKTRMNCLGCHHGVDNG